MIIGELSSHGYQTPALVLPLISVGTGLYAAGLGADGIGPVAVQSSNLPVASFFDAIRGGLLTGVWRYVVFISSLLRIAATAIPSGWALYGVVIASVGVFAPIGISLGRSA